eukprot:CAMPEP_0178913204 /NCGR_PEP_ID=MMETSP0786-20121207/10710_1 /TAXON_ID=186022 /ORGANISM="Thalassionema frauenfeldii, Strain CCMP 1798" /LENGTH=570 /DNA_ID=CAMNT_0020585915 /DNA_START=95 /DNA_END=1804 /DNA_ORIENTATION=+
MGDWHSSATAPATLVAENDKISFASRRSPVLSRHASVATSQPLATSIGIDLLRRGANAADVAVAVAAALAVTEPCSTGLGGDMFCLFYDANEKKVRAINGSGPSPKELSLEKVMAACPNGESDFMFSPLSVTVPGAARGWEDTLNRFGSKKFSFEQLLEPAAKLAEEGFPVSPITAFHWGQGKDQLKKWVSGDGDDNDDDDDDRLPFTVDGTNTPRAGEIFRNPDLARVLRELGRHGATKGFYCGTTGQAIVEAIQDHGGIMTVQDLEDYTTSLFPEPIFAQYRDVKLWQVPPNGQGIAALIALSGLQSLEDAGICPKLNHETVGKSADSYHVLVEMMRLGFLDTQKFVACPNNSRVSTEWLLDKDRIRDRATSLFDPKKATCHAAALPSSDTVSFQVVDTDGNAISFVNSNFMGFGTGLVPKNCGFTLQNRGFNFSLDANHDNCVAGNKRPYHTIIPAILTYAESGDLYATLSNMGGFMQPQGHLQLTINMVAGGLDPQEAIDLPRFCIPQGQQNGMVHFETGIPDSVVEELKTKGHADNMTANVSGHDRSIFGRAQIIQKDPKNGVLW